MLSVGPRVLSVGADRVTWRRLPVHDVVVEVSLRPQSWQLRAPAPVLRRPDGVVQLGLEPPAGVLLGSLPPAADQVLDALLEPCSMQRLARIAGRTAEQWLPGLLAGLERAGLLRRPEPPAGAVTVVGTDQLALQLTRLLLDTIAGPIDVVLPGIPVPPTALTRLQGRHPGRVLVNDHLSAERTASQLTLVCVRALEADRALLRQVAGPHLVVACSDLGAGVGPMVVPGRTACLRCEDLHRLERDPAWPELLLQLSRPRATDAAAVDLQWAASSATLQAASWLAGGVPDSLGACLVLDADGALRVRRLRAHPGCGCGVTA